MSTPTNKEDYSEEESAKDNRLVLAIFAVFALIAIPLALFSAGVFASSDKVSATPAPEPTYKSLVSSVSPLCRVFDR